MGGLAVVGCGDVYAEWAADVDEYPQVRQKAMCMSIAR